MSLQDSLQRFLLRELAHLAQQCLALVTLGNSPAGIAIDNQVFLRDEERLLEDSRAEFFEREEPCIGWPEVLLKQAWMRLEGIRSYQLHSDCIR